MVRTRAAHLREAVKAEPNAMLLVSDALRIIDRETAALRRERDRAIHLLRGEHEQHEAFYVQSGIRSRVHDRGLAEVAAFLSRHDQHSEGQK